MKSEEKLISVIMPAYNAAPFIRQAIECILNQSYKNIELLIADDQSTDDTSDILKSYHTNNRIRLLPNEQKLGYTKTCNRLFAACRGEYISFQDADDYSTLDRLKEQVDLLELNEDIMMCGTGTVIITEKGIKLDEVYRSSSYEQILKNLDIHNQFIGSTIVCRRQVLDEVGYYRSEFSRWGNQDYDWSYRICEKYKAVNIPKAMYFYRQNVASNSKKISELRAIGPEIVQHLGRMRKLNGTDFLMENNAESISDLESTLLTEFKKDPSLIYFKHAENRIYIHKYKEAWDLIIEAISKNPLKAQNYTLMVSLAMRLFYRKLIKRRVS